MAQAEIREAVGGVVFAGRSEGQQAAARAGNGDQRGVKNRHAQNEHGNQPCVRELRAVGRIFSPSVAIRKPRNMAPPSPMKIFAGLKFQRRKPSAAPSVAAARVEIMVWPFTYGEMVKNPAATAAMPAQRPSM